MKFSATALLLSAAIGASAHPSGHAHRHAHRSLEARDFFMAKKPAPVLPPPSELPPPPKPAPASEEAPPPPPKPTVEAPPPAQAAAQSPAETSSAPSSGSSGGFGTGADTYTPFCSGKKRATAAQIAYKGNVGGTGPMYGCNMQLIKSNIADQYDSTIKFTNAGSQEQECYCWNKIGRDNGINGFFNGNQAVEFMLSPGGEQYVAFDSNTQGGCACGAGSMPLTDFGQFASTWAEFDFGNESNGGWAGFDASCLVSAKYGLNIPGLKMCGGGVCSTINAGGTGDNAYLAGMEDLDGIGGNLPPGDHHLTVIVDY